jgi:hypothetical protein
MRKIFSLLVSEKINPWYIIGDHLNTFVDARNIKHQQDYYTFFGLPALISFIAVITGVKLDKDLIDIINTGLALFAGLFLSVSIQLISIDSSKLPKDGLGFKTRNQTVHNISFLIFLSLVTMAFAYLALYEIPPSGLNLGWREPINKCYKSTIDFLTIWALVVFLLTVMMVLKRTSTLFSLLTDN